MFLIGIFKCVFIKNTQNQTNKGHVQLASLEKYLDFENVQSENPQYNNEKWVLSFQKFLSWKLNQNQLCYVPLS